MLPTLFIMSLGGCPAPEVKTVEVQASIQCKEGDRCFSVTKEFLLEHGRLFDENIRMKAALKICNDRK
jgi:hypothetical protein